MVESKCQYYTHDIFYHGTKNSSGDHSKENEIITGTYKWWVISASSWITWLLTGHWNQEGTCIYRITSISSCLEDVTRPEPKLRIWNRDQMLDADDYPCADLCSQLFFFQILTVFHFLLIFLLAVHQLCSISDTLRIVFCHVTSMCLLNSSFVFILAYQLVKSARAWLSSDFSNLNCLLCCCS